ncbi:MAG: LamG domain-containing protein [Acidobacteriia bacterium]|nr:LamG domain-containing protein [Terriglobia bacterium]
MNLSSRLFLALSFAPLLVAQTQFSTDLLALNPLGFWPLNGDANDTSGHGNNGHLTGVTFTSLFPPPVEAQAAVFDRSQGQFISLSAQGSVGFNFGSLHPFTAMAWIRTLGLRHMAIVAKLDQTAGWTFGIDSKQGRPSLLFLVGGQPVLGVESTVAVNDGAWHLVATTYDGSGRASGIRLYVDGVNVALGVGADALGNGSILNSGSLTIGAEPDGSDGFEGSMNDAAVFGVALTPAQILQLAGDTAITKAVLGQFAFGGGWYSAIYFSNTGLSDVSFPVSFTADNGTPLNVPSIGGSSKTITLAAGASTVIEAPNVGQLQQGYVSVTLPVGVTGYGVFRQSVPGVADQEAVVPLAVASMNVPLIYDETNGIISAGSIVNTSAVLTTVTVTVSDTNGNVIGTSSPLTVQPFSKTAGTLRGLPGLSQVVGTRGTARFTVSTGSIAVLGLRFKGLAFTSIPAAPQNFKFVGAP